MKMNGVYYEITGGLDSDIIQKAEATPENDRKAKFKACDTERAAYRNTYKDGKRIESVKLFDPYDDEFYAVGTDEVYYEPLPEDVRFEYQMLGRLKSDCDYFLGNGNGYEPHLWAGSVERQIEEMRKRWEAFPEGGKPEWLSLEDIDIYEVKMLKKRRVV